MAGPTAIELARAAVRRLADADPTADAALDALALIERTGTGPPYTIAIAGDAAARAALLNQLAGEPLFDPARHEPDRIVLTLRRGAMTCVRARRRDGSVEQRALDAAMSAALPIDPRLVDDNAATTRIDVEAVRAATQRALAASASPAGAPAPAEAPPAADETPPGAIVVPSALAATGTVRRPPWWAVWQWLLRWLRAWRAWRRPAAPAAPVPTAPASAASAPAIAEPPSALAQAPANTALGPPVERPRPAVDPRRQFIDALGGLLADDTVERLFVEVSGGPLPEAVVVVDLPSRAHPKALGTMGADACLVACSERGFAMTSQLRAVLAVVPHLFVVGATALPAGEPRALALGSAGVAAELPRLAMIERSLAVGRRAVAMLSAGCATLDEAIADAEAGFRTRIERLAALRIADLDDHTDAALARARHSVVDHAHHLMLRALDQLDDAIARAGAAWAARLRDAASTEALRAAAAKLDEESLGVLQAAQADVQRALVAALADHARDHHRRLAGELRLGASSTDAAPPALIIEVHIDDMTSGTSLGAVAPRLSSLFRSLDGLKTEALLQLELRITTLRQHASTNLLAAEPRLEPAVTAAVAIALHADVERHAAWLDGELAREHADIDAERAQFAVLAIIRDTAAADARQLAAALEALAAELP